MTVFQTPYQQQSDEALCALAAQGDGAAEEALISRYTRMVRRLSRPLFLMGGDSEESDPGGDVGSVEGRSGLCAGSGRFL